MTFRLLIPFLAVFYILAPLRLWTQSESTSSHLCSARGLIALSSRTFLHAVRLGIPERGVRVSQDLLLRGEFVRFECTSCCFDGNIEFDHVRFSEPSNITDSEFASLIAFHNSRLPSPFTINNAQFSGGLEIDNTNFASGLAIRNSTVDDAVSFDALTTGSVVNISNSVFRSDVRIASSSMGDLICTECTFEHEFALVDNIQHGFVVLTGAVFDNTLLLDHVTISGGIDLRTAQFNSRAQFAIKNSLLTEPILAQGSQWSTDGRTWATLDLSSSTLPNLEGLDWNTFKRLVTAPHFREFSSIDERRWNEYTATLRLAEAGYRREGQDDSAQSAELYRLSQEAHHEGLRSLMLYWFLKASCLNGYRLWWLPLWWLATITVCGTIIWLHALPSRSADHMRRYGHAPHHLRDFGYLLFRSLESFFNFNTDFACCWPERHRHFAEEVGKWERLIGAIMLFASAALAGAYLSK